MQQRFSTRSYSIQDFAQWEEKGELVLAPKFQRRDVWSPLARSYLIDTIIRGKPIPKIYMRQDINPKTRRTVREIVDGQQRLRSVLTFLKNGFKISKAHNDQYGGKYFSDLDDDAQKDILRYEFVVDLLQDMADQEVYDVFARLNTYAMTLNYQELRHAKFFGEFKTSVYVVANEFTNFWTANKIFTDNQVLRMAEAELVSELFIAMSIGIRAKEKRIIDNFYRDNDPKFPGRKIVEEKFRETMDHVGGIMGGTLAESSFKSVRLFYPLFCAVYHMQYKLPEFEAKRKRYRQSEYPKLRTALGQVDYLFAKQKVAEEETETEKDRAEGMAEPENEEETLMEEQSSETETFLTEPLLPEELAFFNAYTEHWVHAENRKLLTEYICNLMVQALEE